MIDDLTTPQLDAIDRMAEMHHLVMVEMIGTDWAWLTPADFCFNCGGDGINPDSYDNAEQFTDCPPCKGSGGIAVTGPSVLVMPNGAEVSQ